MIIRSASRDELGSVLAFWQVAAENGSRPVDTLNAVEGLYRRDPEALLLAVDPAVDQGGGGGVIGGTVIAGWDGWRGHLYRLAVAPSRRREGIGGLLIAAAEERFREFGAGRVDAMVLDGNARAHGIWAASGYRRQDDWSRWVKPLIGRGSPQPTVNPSHGT